MDENFKFIKGYQNNDVMRKSFNDLANSTFGLDFEGWYQNGYWGDNYIPYSICHKEKVVANVSVSPMKFHYKGEVIDLIQLGTVMTEESYRNQGLIRRLMEEVSSDYQDKVQGSFLFANDSVLDFYPKFGYRQAKEYEYYKTVKTSTEPTVEKVSMEEKNDWTHLEDAIKTSCINGSLWAQDNRELVMFYVLNFMKDNVYFVKSQDSYVIGEKEKDQLFIHDIFAGKEVDLDEIFAAFGGDIKKVVLGFTPLHQQGYERKQIQEGDTTLYVKGSFFDIMEGNFLRIPTLAHT